MKGVIRKAALGLAVTLSFFAAVEGVLWLAGVVPLDERTDSFVGFAGYSPLFVEARSPDGTRVLRTADAKFDWFNRQQFPAAKAPEVRRAFCLGGSTTYGRPYDDRTSFCGWLREFLAVADPATRWEVINAGGISYASYRIVRIMEELVAHDPDLFVVYTGHNEFLERRTYDRLLRTPEIVRDLGALASGLRLYSLLSDVVYPPESVLDSEIDVLLDRSVGPEDYHRDDALHEGVRRHFRSSLERMVDIGTGAGADLVFVTPASNVRDFSPFKAESASHLAPDEVARVARLGAEATRHLDEGRPGEAVALAERALDEDPRDAGLLFVHGRALLATGDAEAARRALVAARDEDVAPLRAPTPLTRIVAEVAEERGVALVDFAAMARAAAPEGIPGDGQFLDHVHPTIDAHRALALALFDTLVEMEVARAGESWDEAAVDRVVRRVMGGIDDAAHARALANLARVMSWAGKDDEALRIARRATETAQDPHALFQMVTVLQREGRLEEAAVFAGQAASAMPGVANVRRLNGMLLHETGRSREALAELEAAVRLDPSIMESHFHLGVVLDALGRGDDAEAAYRAALALDPRNAATLNNLGSLMANRGDVAGALALFERAVRADPNHASARRNLERARRMLGG